METKSTLFSSALKSGLIIGAVSIVTFLFMYVFDIKPVGILIPILILIVSIGISIAILVVLLKKYRVGSGGYISFGNAFLYAFIAFSISVILYQGFNYIFLQLIDPEYNKTIMEAQKTWMESYLSGKMSDEQITEQLDKLDEQAAKMGSFSTLLKNTFWSIIVFGIVALIVGAIMKKKPDMFETTDGGAI